MGILDKVPMGSHKRWDFRFDVYPGPPFDLISEPLPFSELITMSNTAV
jgi:hypothetical protein